MKRVLIAMVWFYKRSISPYLRGSCRFTPTCSEYAIEALKKYGALKGMGLSQYDKAGLQKLLRDGFRA
jgi:putative membrane protein insertion efficiency factor